jgi:cyclic pyranopterin phosphate synthase
MVMRDPFNRRIHYLRVAITDRCNLRCQYCMPQEGVSPLPSSEILSFSEICSVVETAVDLGVDKVRLTGGEPTVRPDVLDLVAHLARIPGLRDLAMTTNGVLLKKLARPLRQAGLNRLNISLDSLSPERFFEISRGGVLADVLAGIDAARDAGFSVIKLNCVIKESPAEEDARQVAAFGAERGLQVRFIRQMNTEKGEFWPVIGGDGGCCGSCNRLRLSSTGKIYPCIFSDVAFDVRAMGARAALLEAVASKPEAGNCSQNRFSQIGG